MYLVQSSNDNYNLWHYNFKNVKKNTSKMNKVFKYVQSICNYCSQIPFLENKNNWTVL